MSKLKIITIVIIIFTIFGSAFIFLQSNYVLDRTRNLLIDQLEKRLEHDVEIGAISGNLLTGVKIDDIAISPPNDEKIIETRQLLIRYHLWGLLFGRLLVRQIELRKPIINVEITDDGTINLTKLLPKSSASSSLKIEPRVAQVRIRDGSFNFRDEKRSLSLSISGLESRFVGPMNRWSHIGTINVENGEIALNGVSKRIEKIHSQFEVIDRGGELKELRLEIGNSTVVIIGKSEDLKTFESSAEIDLDFRDFAQFLPESEVDGGGKVSLTANGTLEEIVGKFGLDLPSARLDKIAVKNFSVIADFNSSEIDLKKIDGELAGGKLIGSAKISQSEDLKYSGEIELNSADAIEFFPIIEDVRGFLKTHGKVDLNLDFRGVADEIEIDGDLTYREADLNGIVIKKSIANWKIREDQLIATANLDNAKIDLNGVVGLKSERDLKLKIGQIDLGKLSKILSIPDLAGIGKIDGTISPNDLIGVLRVPKATLFGVPIGVIKTDFRYADGYVHLQPITLRKNESRITIRGKVRTSGDLPADLTLTAEPLKIPDYIRLVGNDYPIEGEARGAIRFDNTLSSLNGRGDLKITNVKAWGLKIDDLDLPLVIDDYDAHIRDFILSSREQSGILNAIITSDLNYELDFRGDAMGLHEILIAKDLGDFPLDAKMFAHAFGSGHASDPRIDLDFKLTEVSFAENPLLDVRASGVFSKEGLNFEGFGFDDTCRIHGTIAMSENNPYEIRVRARNLMATPILPIINPFFRDRFTGESDGEISLTGLLIDPMSIRIDVQLSRFEVQANGHDLHSPDPVLVRYVGDTWFVDQLNMIRPNSNYQIVKISDTSVSPTEIDFYCTSDPFSIKDLTDLFPEIPPIFFGTAQYTAKIDGDPKKPIYALNWSFDDLRVQTDFGTIEIDQPIGDLIFDGENLTLQETKIDLLGNEIHIYGGLPIGDQDLPNLTKNMTGFTIQSNNFDLATLHKFIPDLSILGGRADAIMQIDGSILQPSFNATASIAEIAVGVPNFPSQIDRLAAQIEIAGWQNAVDKIAIKIENIECECDSRSEIKGGAVIELIDTKTANPKVKFDAIANSQKFDLTHLAKHFIRAESPPIQGTTNFKFNLASELFPIDLEPSEIIENLHFDLLLSSLQIGIYNSLGEKIGDFTETQPIRFTLDKSWFDLIAHLQNPENSSSWIASKVRLHQNGDLNFNGMINKIPIAIPLAFTNSPIKINGLINSEIEILDQISSPKIDANWEIAFQKPIAKALKPKFVGEIFYTDRKLKINNSRISGFGNELNLEGSVPINLAFTPITLDQRCLDEKIDVRLRGDNADLNFLAAFHPEFEWTEGIADVDLNLIGTTAHPRIDGTTSMKNGRLKLRHFDVPLTNGEFSIIAQNGEIEIPKLDFSIGDGNYKLSAKMEMDDLRPLQLEIPNFSAQNARIDDFARNFLKGDIAESLGGSIFANVKLKLPTREFIGVGETAWNLKLTRPFDLPNLVEFANGEMRISGLTLKTSGDQGWTRHQIANRREIFVKLEDQDLKIKPFILTDRMRSAPIQNPLEFQIGGAWQLGKSLDFGAKMKNFDLSFLSDFVPREFPISGQLDADLRIRGTGKKPEILLRWQTPETAKLTIRSAEVDRFEGKIFYKDGFWKIGDQTEIVVIEIGKIRGIFSGVVPYEISISQPPTASRQPPIIEGRADLDIQTLDFLPMIFPNFSVADGRGTCNFTIGGTIKNPQIRGTLDLRNAIARVPSAFTNVENGRVKIDFTNDSLKIRRLEGSLNGGNFRVGGEIYSDGFSVNAVNLWANLTDDPIFQSPGIYQISCDRAELSMIGDVSIGDALEIPTVRGTVRISSGLYEQNWRQLLKNFIDKESEIQFEVLSDYPIIRDLKLDIDLVAPSKFMFVSDLGDSPIETSINGKVVGSIQKPIFSGRVDLLEGEFKFFAIDYPFTIKDGSYVENTDPLIFNPFYEIYAETTEPIRNVELVTVDGQIRSRDLNVNANLSGFLNETHNPELSAEILRKEIGEAYQLTPTQIVSILTLGNADIASGQNGSADLLTSGLVLRQGERIFGNQVAKIAGFRETRFTFDPEGLESSRFLFTKEISKRLALTYSSTFQLHTEARIEIEYQLNKHIAIKGERNELGKYGIDLKIEREF